MNNVKMAKQMNGTGQPRVFMVRRDLANVKTEDPEVLLHDNNHSSCFSLVTMSRQYCS